MGEQGLVWSCVCTHHEKRSGVQLADPPKPPTVPLPLTYKHVYLIFSLLFLLAHPFLPRVFDQKKKKTTPSPSPSFDPFMLLPPLVFAKLLFLRSAGVRAVEFCWQPRPASSLCHIPMLGHCKAGGEWSSPCHSQGSELGSFNKSFGPSARSLWKLAQQRAPFVEKNASRFSKSLKVVEKYT